MLRPDELSLTKKIEIVMCWYCDKKLGSTRFTLEVVSECNYVNEIN